MKFDHQPLSTCAGVLYDIIDDLPKGHPARLKLSYVINVINKINVVVVAWDDYLAWFRRKDLRVIAGGDNVRQLNGEIYE